MLRRLELIGFKSFADKTVFEFGNGITGIVGPNGSGKSNIVDAVRWLMGEQSAKSLRGGEMTDVIFNGSSTRRSLGLAEVTMTFDNRQRQLAIDAEEVQITRRVYRTGEGEYLINGGMCRLKDIKELFLGSGAGNDAYCIIAQGRVDALLQASTKDRRTIFEEAAGISRFKAKKIEALRKLERVDQNLQRVQDIVDEVEKQLRSVKLQASKAQRYQEYTNRLRDLRLGLGLQEYRQLTEKLDGEVRSLDELRGELDQRAARAGACEAEAERLEIFLADLEDGLREQEALLAQVFQQITTGESTVAHESTLSIDLELELSRTRKRLMELNTRVATLAETTRKAEEELAAGEAQADERRQDVQAREALLQTTIARLAELNEQVAADKAEHLEQMRRTAHLQNEAVSSKAQVDNLRRERDRLRMRSTQAAETLASVDLELHDLVDADTRLSQRLGHSREELAAQRQRHDQLVTLRDTTGEHVSVLRQERSGLASRIEVLEGLIRSHEGLGAGVREMIALTEGPEAGPWGTVVGMVADFLTVKREYAPLIDLALGDGAQRFVVRDVDQLVQALARRTEPLAGRVGFLPLATPADVPAPQPLPAALLGRARQPGDPTPTLGLVAPAEQLVSCDHPELADLPAQLLGRTVVVRDLAAARALATQAPGYRFVTLRGELLEPDGTLTVGTHHAETGILSRKSELRELREQMTALDARLAGTEQDLQALRDQLHAAEVQAQERQQEIDVLSEQAADLRARVQRHRDRRQGLHDEVVVSRDEMQRLDQEVTALEEAWQAAHAQAADADAQVQRLHARLHAADEEIRRHDQDRQKLQQTCTQAQVALAKVEERLRGLRAQHDQAARDYHQRRQEWEQSEQALAAGGQRLRDSQLATLRATASLARAYLDKEVAQRQVADMEAQRDRSRQERARLTQQAQAVRVEWRKHQEKIHQRDLQASEFRHQRDSLVQRLHEDYQIDLAELYQKSLNHRDTEKEEHREGVENEDREELVDAIQTHDLDSVSAPVLSVPLCLEISSDQAHEEIEELRRKLSRLGSVNLDSLQELNELESRATDLQTQFDDLANAKKALVEIIEKINGDSRRLFVETFGTIRTHFQELFRKLFGGGMADVILEDEADVLDCGIEINARPPGKELRSISLLSGGEKTLTAVALLLAIFRSKPSPFCLLDEVDAALDEANIGRYTGVLREFSDRSQFIVVTHSKRTMGAADVLYGITMQESGISKQVTIRFEDWVEDEPPEATAKSA